MNSTETLAKQVFGKDYGDTVRIKPFKSNSNGNSKSVDWRILAENLDQGKRSQVDGRVSNDGRDSLILTRKTS